MSDIQALLTANEEISRDLLHASADQVDQSRRFPRENMVALGNAGVLGLLVPNDRHGHAHALLRHRRDCLQG